MTDPLYIIRNLVKQYDDRTAVDIAALEICAGEILAIVGPSGAGKSTLFRLLNFIEQPTSGTITYRGRAAGNLPLAIRREVTTVFQRPVLLTGDVYKNVACGLEIRGERVDGQVDDLLERVGLSALRRQATRRLSGGEMQRVALARALVVEPRVLLLDEPTANLDPYNVGLIEQIVRQQNEERGTTIVLVTHNVFQAKRLAHRVGLMLSGSLVELSTVDSFFNAPVDARTAAFVRGDMVY